MGTPEFSVPTLQQLHKSTHNIQLVVTQPDRPKGRGRESMPSPVKRFALEEKIPVFQPEKCSAPDVENILREYDTDVFVVVAFGQILSENLLLLPRNFCINLHSSLLPKYRGAAPINWAIINGETETGITTMKMDSGLDTGDILLTHKVLITPSDDAKSLHDTLALEGPTLMLDTLKKLESGTLKSIRQNSDHSTYAPKLKKKDGLIDWNQSAFKIHNRVRGLLPWPGAYSFLGFKRFQICKTEIKTTGEFSQPGIIVRFSDIGIEVGTADGIIIITELQPEGKKRMHVRNFLSGYKLVTGSQFTKQPIT